MYGSRMVSAGDQALRVAPGLWGQRPHFVVGPRQQPGQWWGQRPHYLRVEPEKAQVAVELAAMQLLTLAPSSRSASSLKSRSP